MDFDHFSDQPLDLVMMADVAGQQNGYLQTAFVEDVGLASTSYWLDQPFDTAIDALRIIRRQRCVVANQLLEQSP